MPVDPEVRAPPVLNPLQGALLPWLVLLACLAGCSGTATLPDVNPEPRTLVYVCGDFEFVVHRRGPQARLYLPLGEHDLPLVGGNLPQPPHFAWQNSGRELRRSHTRHMGSSSTLPNLAWLKSQDIMSP